MLSDLLGLRTFSRSHAFPHSYVTGAGVRKDLLRSFQTITGRESERFRDPAREVFFLLDVSLRINPRSASLI
ncbi:MAG: hypothetical protein CL908_20205 [Deltaproteobacteria bacterium]|nr:hypothetical protein [Deltaproteobacteria bacterium]